MDGDDAELGNQETVNHPGHSSSSFCVTRRHFLGLKERRLHPGHHDRSPGRLPCDGRARKTPLSKIRSFSNFFERRGPCPRASPNTSLQQGRGWQLCREVTEHPRVLVPTWEELGFTWALDPIVSLPRE